MPISRREFESGELDPSLLIIEYLRRNTEYAYTFKELSDYIESEEINLTPEGLQRVLSILEAQERIESKTIHNVIYYICRKSLGFRQS